MKLSEHQRDVLEYLARGAIIKAEKQTGNWLCRLPNGMGFKVKKTTMNSLYLRQLISQISHENPDYTITSCGHYALSQSPIPSTADVGGSR